MLVGPSNTQCWTLQWKAKSRCVLIKMLGSAEGNNENRLLIWWRSSCASVLDFASHFFLPLFGTIVSTQKRRFIQVFKVLKCSVTFHPSHHMNWLDLLFGCVKLVKSTYDHNHELIYIVWFWSSLKQSAQALCCKFIYYCVWIDFKTTLNQIKGE